MTNQATITGNQNISIQGVTDSTITLYVNGETQEIRHELAALKEILQKYHASNFQTAQNIYNIGQINEANFGFVTGKKAFNELLTKQLIETLRPHSVPADRFLQNANNVAPDWESQTRISDKAKDIIAYSFVGVLGIQLRKLMAIGKEDLSETKQRKYIENCVTTTQRALQLLCFALLSKLWDYKKTKEYSLSASQIEALTHFFDDEFELDITGYLHLLQQLYAIYLQNQLDFPMSELTAFGESLQPESAFLKACEKLHAINELLDKAKFTLLDCFEAETQLTTVLTTLIFFTHYKMVSIKSIAYDEMRNSPPRYLHSYAALGIDSKFNVNSERVNYVADTICTDAILLFKGRYQESINLFPFVIDLNALTFEGGAKICFYSFKDLMDGSLNYRFLEDNSVQNIVFKETLKSDVKIEDLNELMMDKAKRKQLKLDVVFLQFQEARKTLLSAQAEDDFDNLFEGEKDF